MEKFLQQHYNKVQISRQLPQISMPSNQKNQTCKICNTKSKIAQMQHFVMSPINKNHIHIVKQKALSYYVELQRSFWFNDWFEGYSLVKTQSDKVGKIFMEYDQFLTIWTTMKIIAWSLATRNWNLNLNHQRSIGTFARNRNTALHSVQWAKAKPSCILQYTW